MSNVLSNRGATEKQANELTVLIPKKLLDYHTGLAAKQEEAYWGSGELSLQLQELHYPDYSKAAIRKMVGDIYGIGMNTVRDRERIAQAVPTALRNAVPYLKFSHWRNVVPAGPEKAYDIVCQAQAMYEAEGRGPTVDQIRAWVGSKGMRAVPPWIYRNTTALEKMEMVRDDHFADPQIRAIYDRTIIEVEKRGEQIKLDRFLLEEPKEDEDE